MNAVICMLNSKYVHSSLAPWYLLAGVETYCDNGIAADVVEGTVNMDVSAFADRIIGKSPTAVGFCSYIWNISFIKKLLPVIKKALPGTVIILGGPEAGFNAKELLYTDPLIDYVISGEGEKPFAFLLNALSSGKDVSVIPGVCYREDGKPVISPPHCPADEPPDPYGKKYFEALGGRIAYLETSRGCPFSCAFCLSGRIGGARFFDLERAKRDLLLLSGSSTQTVKLVDRTFNADRLRAREIFNFIFANYGTEIPERKCFHFEIAGDLLDDTTLELLEKAPKGVIQFEIGMQSFNLKTLEAVCRKTDIDRLKRNIERLISFGNIHIHIDLIAGLPYEDYASFAESFNTAYALHPHMLQLGFLKILHGAPMREGPQKYPCRYAPNPPYEVIETPWLSRAELVTLHWTEEALERLYNSGRFRRTLTFILGQTGLTPFELFLKAGGYISEKADGSMPLDDFIAVIFEFFISLGGIDKSVLRDVMVQDRLATNSSRLPYILRLPDSRLKSAARRLDQNHETKLVKGIKRGIAILPSKGVLVYADYHDKDPVSGEYELKTVQLET